MNFVRVALDVPINELFDYGAATASRDDLGQRVLVPFGRKVAVGVIIELSRMARVAPERVRGVLEILRDGPPLPAELLALLAFCSKYYHHPIGEVVLNSLPSRLRRAHAPKRGTGFRYRL